MTYQPRDYWSSLHERQPGALATVGYAALGNGFNRVAYRRRIAALQRLITRLGVRLPIHRVLEGAAGVGAYASLWATLGVQHWTGVDISETAVAELRNRFPGHRFHAVDLSATEVSAWEPLGTPRSYDLVTAIDVLYHLTEDDACRRAMANLARFVAPGGTLILSDVFVQEAQQRASHVRRRPYAFYRDALASVGFVEAGREPIFAVLGDPVARDGFHPADAVMWNTWRLMQKVVRSTPPNLRNAVGAAAAWALYPIDTAICALGLTSGVNLELAAFRAPG